MLVRGLCKIRFQHVWRNLIASRRIPTLPSSTCQPVHQRVQYIHGSGVLRKKEDINRPKHELYDMMVLGIETSCDETGAAVVDGTGQVLGESIASQHELHLRHGGINPVVAKQLHASNIASVVEKAMACAGLTPEKLSAVAVTVKPGLGLALSVGVNYAKSLALSAGVPLIPIHHMEAHAITARLQEKVDFPYLVLLVSGGHCQVVVARGVDDWALLASTVDDAPGEALDKGARRMKLRNLPQCSNMSGGRAIEYLAERGDPHAHTFPRPMLQRGGCSFSFAGLKEKLRQIVTKLEEDQGVEGGQVIAGVEDVCASYQYAITAHLLRQTQRAMVYVDVRNLLPNQPRTLVVSGGVACNQYLRRALEKLCEETGYVLVCPSTHLCSDNGVMIAWNGVERLIAGCGILTDRGEIENVKYQPKAPMGEDLTADVLSLGIKSPKAIKF